MLLLLAIAATLLSCGTSDTRITATSVPGRATQSPASADRVPGNEATTEPLPTATVSSTPTPPAPLAALVNGEYIFLSELERQMALYETAMYGQGADLDTPELQAHLSQVRLEVLESLIDYTLVRQEAEALALVVSDKVLEAQLESDIDAGGGLAAFEEWLQVTGQTREDYKETLHRSMLSQRVLEEVTSDLPTEVEQVHARQIVVGSLEVAQQIHVSLRDGGDFAELARDHSLDLATKDAGGDLGWFPRGWVAPEVESIVFSLQPGEFSDAIPVGEEYYIIQVVDWEAARPLPDYINIELKLAAFDQWLEERRSASEIERFAGP